MTVAIILSGGLGTRLQSLVQDQPKPMAKIGDRPFLEYLMDYWIYQGVSQFILSVGYKRKIIISHFGSKYKETPIVYVEEKELLGTGGGLVLAMQGLSEPFLLLNGDTYFEVSLEELKNFHEEKKADWTIALFQAKEADRYGRIDVDSNGKINQLKTANCQIGELANGGVYFISPMGLTSTLFKPGNRYSLEEEILPKLINEGKNILGLRQSKSFLDIGIPADYLFAQSFIPALIKK